MYRLIAFVVLLILLTSALYVPVGIPYRLFSIAQVSPLEEWRLSQDATNGLAATHQDYQTGRIRRINSWQFQRGDISAMELTIPGDSSVQIALGDTIVRMFSALVQQEILDIENELKALQSETKVLTTGEKIETIQQAKARLEQAKTQLQIRQKEFDINKDLFEKNVIARLEYIRSENALDQAKAAVITAEKELLVVETGVKVESVDFNRTQITNLQRKLAFLRERRAGYVIRAPFSGTTAPIREVGEVLILQNLNTYVLQIPVKVEEMRYINSKVKIAVTDPFTGKIFLAKYLGKAAQTQVIDSRSVGFITALIEMETAREKLTLGIASRCEITCDELNPRQFLARLLNFRIQR
jgi:hypothetical protein